jgi:site-specific DNA recombinase
MRADLYIRVSTDEQAERGYSQRDQEERLRKYCSIQNIEIRDVIYEDHSAKTFIRPAWTKFLANIRKKRFEIDRILFIKWDRFSRNTGDAYQMISILRKLGVEPQAIEQPLDMDIPENKIMLAFYLAAPEVENDRRALNTFHGMRRGRKEGRWMSGAPMGYVNKTTEDGRKYITPKEPLASVMKWVFEQVAEGRCHVQQIYKLAKSRGLKCNKSTLWRSLRNPVYCGRILVNEYKDEKEVHVKGNHLAIISEELFYDVQEYLNGKKRQKRTTTIFSNEDFVLRGFLICPKCGKLLTASASKGKTKNYSYYHCRSTCGARFKSKIVNENFIDYLNRFIARAGMAAIYAKIIEEKYNRSSLKQGEDMTKLNNQLNELQELIKKARTKYMNDEIDKEDYVSFKAENEKKILELEKRILSNSNHREKIDHLIGQSVHNLIHLRNLFENGNNAVKRKIVGSIFTENLLFDGIECRTPKLNEAVELIYSVDKGFSEKKMRQNDQKIELSRLVAGTGIEPVFAP